MCHVIAPLQTHLSPPSSSNHTLAAHSICPVMDGSRRRIRGSCGWGAVPVGAPVFAFQSPITGMRRDAQTRDDGAHLTGLETGAAAPRVLHSIPLSKAVLIHGQNQLGGPIRNKRCTFKCFNQFRFPSRPRCVSLGITIFRYRPNIGGLTANTRNEFPLLCFILKCQEVVAPVVMTRGECPR